ncbi:hypothetical protein C2G38_478040 [Gigaspora rosea]|uniref:histidine kinase n=1 Tax=Gigaspora rosea TaxID=44941 RepID=A0A397U9A0_9GLOM|nr:hypothetical protein C2G38_478040 [Gigaspora rosea]
MLGESGSQISKVNSLESACSIMKNILNDNHTDIPYALIYFVEHKLNYDGSESSIARLITTTFDEDGKKERHFPDYFPKTHEIINLTNVDQSYENYINLRRASTSFSFIKCDSWPLNLVIKNGNHIKVILKNDSQAVLFLTKISLGGEKVLPVILICGVNRRRALDEQYLEFLQLVTNQLNTYLLHGKKIEEEKLRSKLLVDLNYQKVIFFQGISHELQKPLTLMLSPLEEVINACPQESPIMSHLQTIRRNAHRLLKLINVLLQSSNVESGHSDAKYCKTNIVELTRELASDFVTMAKTLGLDYIIDIPNSEEFNQTVGDGIYLDHDMYETIIFNLCSNALKHTWKGRINIRLYLEYKNNEKMVILEVSDTGVGIPEIALPNIFQRFYRVESQNSRSHEGTGIGLALVKELITLHGGYITVTSVVNKGTTFKCWFPIGYQHLPKNQIRFNNVKSKRELYNNRQLYLEESSQWIKNNISEIKDDIDDLDTDINNTNKMLTDKITFNLPTDMNDFAITKKKYSVLLVDDSNEMRDHLTDLLKEFDIYRACDGKDALRVLKTLKQLPDLVLSDVTMPNMNGYELLDVLRSNVNTQLIPIILLSAKAGEDSKVKGLDKGADDYLVKPFSARELITRIRANIELSVLRRKILFHRCQEEESKQLLMSIANMIFSGLSINETLQYVVKAINHRIPCERVLVISNEQSKSKANEIIVSYENSESVKLITNPFMEINDNSNNNDKRKSQSSINSQEYLNDNSGIEISLDVYCGYVHKNVSILSSEVKLNNDFWGWIKVYRSPNSIWLDSEIELLQQISNLMSLAITHANLLEENEEKEIQIKAAEVADKTKSQILANTSHELRTPLGAIVGILSSFECNSLTTDQKEMIDTMIRSSDIVLSIINDILDSARLEAQKVTLINKTFDLLVLLDDIIENFGKRAGSKKIELIVNCDVDELPRYVKSDPNRLLTNVLYMIKI